LKRPVSIVVLGGKGRTGKVVVEEAGLDKRFRLAAVVDRAVRHETAGPPPVHRKLSRVKVPPEVVVDFSTPQGTLEAVRFCSRWKCALVSGTTGLGSAVERELRLASNAIPILRSANLSRGANIVFRLSEEIRRLLPEQTDVEILEKHHRWKKDVPSGTSLEIARLLKAPSSGGLKWRVRVGRSRGTHPRKPGEICIHSIRSGDEFGEHDVQFGWEGESLHIVHRVSSRRAFALGALEAALALRGKAPGLYSLLDLL